jgi:sulfotransferase famil protein
VHGARLRSPLGRRANGPEPVAGEVSWPGLQQYFVGRSIGRYLRPVPEHAIIYVKNPKAGCSTIMLWLDRLHTGEYDVEFSNIHEQHRLPKLGEVGRDAVTSMLSGSAFRFSFVRNPLRRFESVYWDKIVFNVGRWRPDLLTAWGLDPEAGEVISFERFLSLVEQQDPLLEMDPHWRPQHINLLHPLVTYDHVGKLETFAADLEHIREAARLPHVPLETRNASKHGSVDSVFHGRPDLIRRVEKLYETDFQLYGY